MAFVKFCQKYCFCATPQVRFLIKSLGNTLFLQKCYENSGILKNRKPEIGVPLPLVL
ncbi:MAG: hypothetical protein HW390_3439 [Candidatus Brocadiaceae bacterium]|nr:hypothetical protein [Candidatus Brocadiaceae bacterium]